MVTSEAGTVTPAVDPQRVTIHRLNRAEYNNTVRDLLGTRTRPADEFPADDRGYGFDNIADVLSVSPLHIEQYDRAAEALVEEALGVPTVASQRWQLEAESLMGSVGAVSGAAWLLWSNGEVGGMVTLPAPGRYRLTVSAWQSRAGTEDARMGMELDGTALRTVMVPNLAASPGEFTAEFTVTRAGPVTVSATFENDFVGGTPSADRNLWVDFLRVEGPLGATGTPPPSRAQWLTCDPVAMGEDACAEQVLTRFGRRAWRRPLAQTEVRAVWSRFRAVTRMHAGTWDDAIKLSMRAMLLSPHFIYRVEIDSDRANPAPHAVTAHELAARLSYFLWSSMPDAELDRVADDGTLLQPAVLTAQAQRMLAHANAQALVQNFAGQWLYTRRLDEHDVNAALYPRYTAQIRDAMRQETEAFFGHFLQNDVSMSEFLTADYSFVDARMAGYYGVTPPSGAGLQRTALGAQRLGFLTQGTLLTVTSHADRTSPVKRGQWVLQQLLCAPPPAPPPNVEGLPTEMMVMGSVRQRLEAHATQPLCRSCHDLMDPIGFGLENFDAVGLHRTMEGRYPIDATGMLPDGTRFEGAQQLARIVSQDPRFARCVSQQMLTYALGRGLNENDDAQLAQLDGQWRSSGLRLRTLITQIVLSDAFRLRRAELGGM
ncbi:MAG: DUF1592 domain-containing protein [Deltaproteobacteria bacterium]|nr:DUF1592 domain-containing protein [Deltaproteobacteria bacterium]